MFNIIKGELVNNNSKPIIINRRDSGKILNTKKEDLSDNEKKDLKSNIKKLDEVAEMLKNKEEELKKIEIKIENSKNEADKILKDAKDKAEYEIDVARNRGFQDGYQDGQIKGNDETLEMSKGLIMRSQTILDEMISLKLSKLEEFESDLLKLSIEIAKKIIKKEIIEDWDVLKRNLIESIKKVPISKKLLIMVNWEDLDYIKDIKNELISQIHGVEEIEIVEDKNIEKGGCILETSMGTIDATINSQLEEAYKTLMEIKSTSRCDEDGCYIDEKDEINKELENKNKINEIKKEQVNTEFEMEPEEAFEMKLDGKNDIQDIIDEEYNEELEELNKESKESKESEKLDERLDEDLETNIKNEEKKSKIVKDLKNKTRDNMSTDKMREAKNEIQEIMSQEFDDDNNDIEEELTDEIEKKHPIELEVEENGRSK